MAKKKLIEFIHVKEGLADDPNFLDRTVLYGPKGWKRTYRIPGILNVPSLASPYYAVRGRLTASGALEQ